MSTRSKSTLLVIGILLMLATPFARADDKPGVWLITLYPAGPSLAIEESMLDALESYGLINPDDRSNERMQTMIESADNSAIQYNRLSANFELERLRELVAFALDHEPDALVTISEPATVAALLATQDLDDPPAIFFADVYSPYLAGIAEAPCIKPDHVSGAASELNYAEIVALLPLQNPDIQVFGTIHNSNDAGGTLGARDIAEAAEAAGLTVEQAAITAFPDLALAAGGLVSKGVEAILLPMDYLTLAGLPLVAGVAMENGIPLYYASLDGLILGATVGAGFSQWLTQGDAVGLMLAAYLAGELDPAVTGISAQAGQLAVGVNLFVSQMMGVEFSQALLEQADMSLTMDAESGLPSIELISPEAQDVIGHAFYGSAEPLEARQERDREFLAGLECTPERIAEEQAELAAREG